MVKFDINDVPKPPRGNVLSKFVGFSAVFLIALLAVGVASAYPIDAFYFQSPYSSSLLAYNPYYAYAIHEYSEWHDPYRGYSAGPPPRTFGGCFISTGKGLLEDSDCDTVPNVKDNCPFTANDQADQTNNGIGDACDIVIQEINPGASVFKQGRAIVTDVQVVNNKKYDVQNIRLSLDIPALGVIAYEELSPLKQGQARTDQIFARIPQCAAPGVYDVEITAQYIDGYKESIQKEISIAIEGSDACPVDQGLGNTFIDILEIQNVDPKVGAIYPFTIQNNEKFDQSYILTVQGEDAWGESQLYPGSLVVVRAGESKEGSIHIWMNEGIQTTQGFVLTISTRDGIAQQALKAKPEIQKRSSFGFGFLSWLFGFILIALIIAGVFLLVRAHKEHSATTTTLK